VEGEFLMLQKSSLQKMVVRLLLAGILLMVCTGVALAADVSFSPTSGSLITAGTPVSATITGVLASDPVSIAVTASGTTATSYGVPSFTMPFQVDGSTFTISGSNVNTISLSVAAPDGTHSVTNHALGTLLSGYTAQAGTYHNNGASITPTISGQPTSVTVTLAGNAHTPISGSTLTWDTTGATVGSTITITIAGQSATYTIVAPTPERDPNTVGGSGDGAPAAGPAAAQRGALQQQQQSTATSTVSVTSTGSVGSGTLSAGSVPGMAGSTASWTSTVSSAPASGATVTTAISASPGSQVQAAIQSALGAQGLQSAPPAYSMTVTSQGTTLGPGTLTMTVPTSYVTGLSAGGFAPGIVQVTDGGQTNVFTSGGGLTMSQDAVTGLTTFTTIVPGYCTFEITGVKPLASAAGNTTVTATPSVTSAVSQSVTMAPTTVPTTLTAPAKATAANDPLASFFAPLLNLLNLG